MSIQKKPRLEFYLNWFDRWNLQWSCTEESWNQFSKKLKSPLAKGIGIATGIGLGIGIAGYCYLQVRETFNSTPKPAAIIEAPTKKGEQ